MEEIENLYAELTSALPSAASSAFETTGKKNEGKFNIPGWNSVVKSKHQIAKAAFRQWANCCRPKTGDIYRNMTKTKKDFKYSLRQCRKDAEMHKAKAEMYLSLPMMTDSMVLKHEFFMSTAYHFILPIAHFNFKLYISL